MGEGSEASVDGPAEESSVVDALDGGPTRTPALLVAREGLRIPVPGGKLIEELMGRVATGTEGFSLAHMVAPGGWTEPPQTPAFGELTIVVRGRLAVEVAGEERTLAAGEAIYTGPGEPVRYGNPFDDEAEYYAICWPAFSPDLAHRQDDEEETQDE